jgi:hypothetical protein
MEIKYYRERIRDKKNTREEVFEKGEPQKRIGALRVVRRVTLPEWY